MVENQQSDNDTQQVGCSGELKTVFKHDTTVLRWHHYVEMKLCNCEVYGAVFCYQDKVSPTRVSGFVLLPQTHLCGRCYIVPPSFRTALKVHNIEITAKIL